LKQEAAMLAIGGIGTSTVVPRTSRRGPDAPPESDVPATAGRALIAIAAPAASERSATTSRRPLAPFLAHLIATQTQAPQTRARRRAEPEEVLGIYSSATKPRRFARSKFDRQT
jgi:hypothetical protein